MNKTFRKAAYCDHQSGGRVFVAIEVTEEEMAVIKANTADPYFTYLGSGAWMLDFPEAENQHVVTYLEEINGSPLTTLRDRESLNQGWIKWPDHFPPMI